MDRTIKHMLFLQNVTKYADKLKQADEPKVWFRSQYLYVCVHVRVSFSLSMFNEVINSKITLSFGY